MTFNQEPPIVQQRMREFAEQQWMVESQTGVLKAITVNEQAKDAIHDCMVELEYDSSAELVEDALWDFIDCQRHIRLGPMVMVGDEMVSFRISQRIVDKCTSYQHIYGQSFTRICKQAIVDWCADMHLYFEQVKANNHGYN
jgi:hypothetical protein